MRTFKSARSAIRCGFLAALIAASLSCSSTKTAGDASKMPDDAASTPDATPADEGGLGEPCATLAGKTFRSINSMECGLGGAGGTNSCPWQVTFNASGGWSWRHSDIDQQGDYSCSGNVLNVGAGITASYDPATGRLTWAGADYVAQP